MKAEIRKAHMADSTTILALIKGLAEYEELSHEVVNTEELIKEQLFGDHSVANCLLAEIEGNAIGLAIYFYNYSTFVGKKGLYLEDFFVFPEYRGHGIGQQLFNHLIKIAVEEDCGRMEWSVLDWNEPALNFYRKYEAMPLEGWTVHRLDKTLLLKKYEKFS